jgi:predicted phage terminase large subunit-like protein
MIDLSRFTKRQAKELHELALLEQERRHCNKLINFVERAWPIIEPTEPFQYNWHLDVICDHLEAITRGELKNLLINVPPGTMKSILVSVMWPAWEWRLDQSLRYFCVSYSETLTIRDSTKVHDIIESDWYHKLWPKVAIKKGEDQKTKYALTGGGWRLATSIGGRGTGEHPDRKIVDDPSNVLQSESDVERQGSLDYFDRTLSTRGASRNAATVVVMQRLHEKDLTGHIMAQADYEKDWSHICLEMEYESDRSRPFIPFTDPRKNLGDLLWPSFLNRKAVETIKMRLGSYGTAGQLQQQPAPEGGGILKVENFKTWSKDTEIPPFFYILQSYDTAFTDKTKNDPTGCLVLGLFRHKGRICVMILDAWDDWLTYPEFREKIIADWSVPYGGNKKSEANKARRPDALLIEEKGSGIAVIQELRLAGIPALSYNPGKASKEQRAHIVAPIVELGIIYVLESQKLGEEGKPRTWARPFLAQVEKFPNAEHDEYVDCLTQALILLRDKGMFDLQEVPEDPDIEVDYHAKKRGNPYL